MSRSLIFINGSPRPNTQSCSYKMIQYFTGQLETTYDAISDVHVLGLYRTYGFQSHYKEALKADVLVFVAPLYVDNFPSCVLDYLEQFEGYIKAHPHEVTHPLKIYGFVNCGFLGGYQNTIALDILKHFAKRVGFTWCGGLGVGSGAMLGGTLNVPREAKMQRPIYEGLDALTDAMKHQTALTTPNKQILVTQNYSFNLFKFMLNMNWIAQSKFKFFSIYHRPYRKA